MSFLVEEQNRIKGISKIAANIERRRLCVTAAMQGILSAMDSAERNYFDPDMLAEHSFEVADAMIKFEDKE